MVRVHATGAPRPQSPLRACAAWICILIIFVPSLQLTALAQVTPIVPQASPRPAVTTGAEGEASEVELLVGHSAVLNVPSPISRVSLTSPDIADVVVTTSQQVLLHGKTVGAISMFVWERSGAIRRYEVTVRRDLSQLEAQMRQLFPGEPIAVSSNGKDVVVSGAVSSKYVLDKAADVAAGYVEKKENVVNLLQRQEGLPSTQVLLRVRFAEVSRTALSELGASLFSDGKNDIYGRSTTQQFAAPFFDAENPNLSTLVFTDYLNLFLFDAKNQIGTLIRALSNRGLFQSLAEPNLIAQNGREASFLAGGEYPYPVVQGTGGGLSIAIQFKEFGIRLNFTPTVLGGDLVHLKVKPEVSSLDFTNAVTLEGFRIPALSTRRAETEVELRDGQTFAIAGLLNNSLTSTMQKIPGIGDIPILGLLFKSRAARKEQTELVVMITPQILRQGSTGAAPKIPDLVDPFLTPPRDTIPAPPPYAPQSMVPPPANQPAPAATGSRTAVSPATPAPAGVVTSTAPSAAATPASAPAPANAASAPIVTPAPRALTRQEREALEQAQKEERKRLEREAQERAEQEKRAAEEARVAGKRAAEERRQQEALAREQAKRDAEAARKAEEVRKQQEEEERKRGKALAEAEARLKAAQAAYQEQVKRAGGSDSQP